VFLLVSHDDQHSCYSCYFVCKPKVLNEARILSVGNILPLMYGVWCNHIHSYYFMPIPVYYHSRNTFPKNDKPL
jgi:hypothetical protein